MNADRPQNRNLRPFPKGVSGNPKGRPKSQVGAAKIRDLIEKLGKMKRSDLDALLISGDTPAFEQLFASVLVKAIKDGDYARMTALLDRLVGKAQQAIESEEESNTTGQKPDLKVFSTEELIRLVKATAAEPK